MSRIIRSLDSSLDSVDKLDMSQALAGHQVTKRPAGGFSGQVVANGPRVSCAEAMLEQARRTVEAAQRQAEQVQREAWHAGFEQGEKAGERLALQKIQPSIDAFAKLIESVSHERANLIRQHEQELIKVAFLIAAKVVRTELDRNDEAVMRTIEAALEKLTANQHVRLCVAPQDLPLVQDKLRSCAPAGWSEDHIAIESDDTVQRGGCRVLTESGMIDATIETQLRMLKERLWEE